MYGLPGQTTESFEYSLGRALALPIQHISSYALSWEEGSVLYHRLQKGELQQASDEMLERCYFVMKDTLEKAGFKHYELSNFARAGFESRHNSLYWSGIPYLGLGPGAHSFDGVNRSCNLPTLTKYLAVSDALSWPREMEYLNADAQYNDFIVTRLRRLDGLDLNALEKAFGREKLDYCLKNAGKSLQNETLERVGQILRLTRKGLFISDAIMSDLMLV
jgi:oxygen-independent coproporphyrinogen III oxidase